MVSGNDYNYKFRNEYAGLYKTKVQWLNTALSYYNLELFDAALKACEQAIELDPNYARAHHGKGLTLSKLGRYEEALTAYDQAMRLNPNNPKLYADKEEVLIARGKKLYQAGHHEEALAAYDQAMRLNPNNLKLYADKEEVLIARGNSSFA